jgi:ABC-type transport system involved in Fe-S cluster assembly fused permease/ATPase subunit
VLPFLALLLLSLLPALLLLLQSAEYRFLSSLNVLNVVQSGIMFIGISAGVLACTAGVSRVSCFHGKCTTPVVLQKAYITAQPSFPSVTAVVAVSHRTCRVQYYS